VKDFGSGIGAFAEEALFQGLVGGYRRFSLSALGAWKERGEVRRGS
jgi:hypothetical protein